MWNMRTLASTGSCLCAHFTSAVSSFQTSPQPSFLLWVLSSCLLQGFSFELVKIAIELHHWDHVDTQPFYRQSSESDIPLPYWPDLCWFWVCLHYVVIFLCLTLAGILLLLLVILDCFLLPLAFLLPLWPLIFPSTFFFFFFNGKVFSFVKVASKFLVCMVAVNPILIYNEDCPEYWFIYSCISNNRLRAVDISHKHHGLHEQWHLPKHV